ncbi:YagK/YfjJ domain-containing protein [Psychrobacter phenylpyruvicus]|uniref:YagK/YfjJ domain-containing protein n=1 Tax=Psychrobacter phenylpyruvicus TaxID=29432 RepID=UPI0015599630|nr:inovirus-type Gp2 protein [Psychrobacter phenylpyruvicus]
MPVNANSEQGCYVEILEALHSQMTAMINIHCKVMLLRADIRLYEYTDDNKVISKFLRQLKKWLRNNYKIKEVGHLWVREREKSKQQHYHLMLMIDANKVRHPKRIIERIDYMASIYNLSAYTPKNCYYLIKRDDQDKFNEAFKRGSYLAKQRGKGYKGKLANNYSASRIKVN